jgi:hypothetical protein
LKAGTSKNGSSPDWRHGAGVWKLLVLPGAPKSAPKGGQSRLENSGTSLLAPELPFCRQEGSHQRAARARRLPKLVTILSPSKRKLPGSAPREHSAYARVPPYQRLP